MRTVSFPPKIKKEKMSSHTTPTQHYTESHS